MVALAVAMASCADLGRVYITKQKIPLHSTSGAFWIVCACWFQGFHKVAQSLREKLDITSCTRFLSTESLLLALGS